MFHILTPLFLFLAIPSPLTSSTHGRHGLQQLRGHQRLQRVQRHGEHTRDSEWIRVFAAVLPGAVVVMTRVTPVAAEGDDEQPGLRTAARLGAKAWRWLGRRLGAGWGEGLALVGAKALRWLGRWLGAAAREQHGATRRRGAGGSAAKWHSGRRSMTNGGRSGEVKAWSRTGRVTGGAWYVPGGACQGAVYVCFTAYETEGNGREWTGGDRCVGFVAT
ncbi:unnamed protein product [Closterium sp. NIES-64]|nr:unnamed protein product [Closterium sp. NIES-64]CAI6005912.1 unnamed protein product [Closterium sp. NIES-64]